MKAIIPIGGRGTRMRPVTFTANKHFIPVGNKPLIFYPIETIADAGIKEVAITYNPGQLDYAKEVLGTGRKWDLKFTYVLQPEPKGLANIYEVCEEFIGNDRFVFHLGDNIFTEGIRELVDYFSDAKDVHAIAVMTRHPENTRLGVPYFDKRGNLIKCVEKPQKPPHNFALPGLYLLDKNAFKVFKGKDKLQPSARGEYEIPDAYQWLIDHGYKVIVKEYKGKWLDPGKFNDWLETNQYLLDRDTKLVQGQSLEPTMRFGSAVRIEGRVEIGKKTKIKNSIIRGPVKIGDEVMIENSFIGPYTAIYHGCEITNCRIENSVLMRNVKLHNIAKLVDTSLIGPDSQISGNNNGHVSLEMFVGEMSKISL
jgi:glucose-1-phosphate thymidylyltransferase